MNLVSETIRLAFELHFLFMQPDGHTPCLHLTSRVSNFAVCSGEESFPRAEAAVGQAGSDAAGPPAGVGGGRDGGADRAAARRMACVPSLPRLSCLVSHASVRIFRKIPAGAKRAREALRD